VKSIKLVHIGDIHYPETFNRSPNVDIKDNGFQTEFTDKLSFVPFMEVGYSLIRRLQNEEISGVLFSGDLTSIGDVDAYQKCVNYFDLLIKDVESTKNKIIDIYVVPGNHDLTRKNLIEETIEARFGDFRAAWESVGRDVLPVQNIKKSHIVKDELSLTIISLNTCIGCGEEYKKFPDEIAAVYKKLIEKTDLEDKDALDSLCERIDTPAISVENLHEIEDEVSESEDKDLCLILGHHALLPQPRLRVAPYTEILNGGNTRIVLTTLNKPIIYCHGHIHDDPIEVVTTPDNEDSNLVLISAPTYSSGFNIIEVSYTDTGYPVGVTIHPHRIENWGHVRKKNSIRIPIRRSENMFKFCNAKTETTYRLIDGSGMRFSDLEEKLSEESILLQCGELENIINELEWLGVISVSNNSDPEHSRRWSIARVGL
jgi:3',5'-cyclic AMP phosphodiesterase CpdA